MKQSWYLILIFTALAGCAIHNTKTTEERVVGFWEHSFDNGCRWCYEFGADSKYFYVILPPGDKDIPFHRQGRYKVVDNHTIELFEEGLGGAFVRQFSIKNGELNLEEFGEGTNMIHRTYKKRKQSQNK